MHRICEKIFTTFLTHHVGKGRKTWHFAPSPTSLQQNRQVDLFISTRRFSFSVSLCRPKKHAIFLSLNVHYCPFLPVLSFVATFHSFNSQPVAKIEKMPLSPPLPLGNAVFRDQVTCFCEKSLQNRTDCDHDTAVLICCPSVAQE